MPVTRPRLHVGAGNARSRDLWALLAMLLLLALPYRRLLAGRVLAAGDLQTYFFPYWVAATRAWQAGRLPLWNPYLFGGAPLLANSQMGALYPVNWLCWAWPAHSLAAMARTLHGSVLLHLAIAALTTYTLARRLGARPWGAALSGLLYAGSGFLGVHVDHLNQLQALAWLPLVLLPRRDGAPRPPTLSIVALALILLSGHTQMAFISLVAVALFSFVRLLKSQSAQKSFEIFAKPARRALRFPGSFELLPFLCALAWAWLPFALAALLAGAQLLPTLELARFSARSGGLDWRNAVSFSLHPREFPRALLAPYLGELPLPEGVAYLGGVGLLLALLGGWQSLRRRDREGLALVGLALGGLALALGGYNPLYLLGVRLGVPGLVHFRAPARFLALYVLGAALLAGMPPRRRRSDAIFGRDTMCVGTPAQARNQTCQSDGPSEGRLLTVSSDAEPLDSVRRSGMESDHSDRSRYRAIFERERPSERQHLAGMPPRRRRSDAVFEVARALLLLLVGIELTLLAEHLPHAAATASRAYTSLRPATAHLVAAAEAASGPPPAAGRFLSISQTLFELGDKQELEIVYAPMLSDEALWAYMVTSKQREVLAPNLPLAFQVPALDGYDGGLLPLQHYLAFSKLLLPGGSFDGRLRENLVAIPDVRWLSLAGVRFIITDKTGDIWSDDVFYDRQFQPTLAPEEVLRVGWLPRDFAADALGVLYQGEGGTVTVTFEDGSRRVLPLPPSDGEQTGRVRWEVARAVSALSFEAGSGGLQLFGTSLLDERVSAFYPLVVAEHFRLAHSGDVKIYENLAVSPRLFLVHACHAAASDAQALDVMRDPAFDPRAAVVVDGACAPALPIAATDQERAEMVAYDPTRVVAHVVAHQPGYLLLTDAWYPGWEAHITPLATPASGGSATRVPLQRADLLWRALPVEAGAWRVEVVYRPRALYAGSALSLLGLLLLLLYYLHGRKYRHGNLVRNRL